MVNNMNRICRTCFDPGEKCYPLAEMAVETKSLLELLREVVQLQIPIDDPLPKTICHNCSSSLKNAYDFITRVHDVNEKYLKLLSVEGDPLQETGLNDGNPLSDCLEESAIDIPFDQYLGDIKLEVADQYSIVLLDKVTECCTQKDNKEQGNGHTVPSPDNENVKIGSILYGSTDEYFADVGDRASEAEEERSTNEYDDEEYNHASSSDESNYEPSKRIKMECGGKNSSKKRRVRRQYPEYFDKIKKIGDRFACFMCEKTFSQRKDCGRHIASIHLRETTYPCEYCGQEFNRKDKVRQHMKRAHTDRSANSKSALEVGKESHAIEDDEEYKHASSSDESYCDPPKTVKTECRGKNNSSKRKVGRQPPDYFDKIKKVNDRFACLMCEKTFSLRKDCGRHIASIHLRETTFPCEYCGQKFSRKDKVRQHIKRMHSDRSVYPKGKRKEWMFGDRLYSKPTTWLLVECKLCCRPFNTTTELRIHMETHSDIDTLRHLELDSEVVSHLFTNVVSLRSVKESICKDISERQWFKYYAVLNEYSYEMSISDTEVEEVENKSDCPKYKCDLCGLMFCFQYEAFSHLKEKHEHDEIMSKCGLCKLEFISSKMYEQHCQVHCRNRNKVLLCTRCPAKFVWPENMRNHNCATKPEIVTEREILKCNVCNRPFEVKTKLLKHLETHSLDDGKTLAKVIIRCGLCTQTFEKLKALRKHITQHSDGATGIDFQNGIYFKRFERSKTHDRALIQQEIQNGFEKSQISRFYRAIDKEGNEMDLLDSDSGSEEETSVYKCELCFTMFRRRKDLLSHQFELHSDVPLPYTCKDCTKQYVSNDLLQQHLYRDCWNEHRRVAQQCEYCNARFIWPNNLVKHKDIQHKHQKQPRPKRASTLKCEYCEKVFIWPKDLVRHRKTHTEGKKFSCPHCDRKFQRKDNLLAHIRTHDPDGIPLISNSNKAVDHILPHLINPHGCKRIKCMICYSEHNRIYDLRSHLRSHQYSINFDKRKETETFAYISKQLYPEELPMDEEEVSKKISSDIVAERSLERFYSITNENGYEVSLDSSETESDTDDDKNDKSDNNDQQNNMKVMSRRVYTCDICPHLTFTRKYKVYEHHQNEHKWEEGRHVCMHCNGRFLSSHMLQLHYKNQCKNARKRHFCRRCPLRFMWKSNLKTHFVMDHSQEMSKEMEMSRRFVCFLCQCKFNSQKDLTQHMSLNHPAESELHYCLLCPKTFYTVEHLNEHLSRHSLGSSYASCVESITHSTCWPNGKKQVKCKVCTLEFETMAELAEHFSSTNPQNICTVQHSPTTFSYSITNQKGFELHLQLDSETEAEEDEAERATRRERGDRMNICKLYVCSLCNVSSERKYQMVQHQRSMHSYESLTLKCEKCIFKTSCQKLLEYHTTTQCYNVEKQYQCEICKFKFMWQENMQNHIALLHHPITTQHKQIEDQMDSKTLEWNHPNNKNDPNIFECMDCHRRYNRRDRYKAHFKKFHNNDAAGQEESLKTKERGKSSPNKAKNFLCAFCGVSFSNNSNLTVHMRRHTGEKPFQCDLCEMAFPRSSDLQSHRRTHTGERPYKCTHCEKSFSRQYKLNVHMRIHTGERPYSCTYCSKSFTQSNDLTLHHRRHTGERPYLCDICGEGFICATSLKQHRNSKGHMEHNVDTEEERTRHLPPHFEMNF